MLVLTRKEGECIRIDHEILIRIHNIGKNRVRVAIDAPPNVPIYREEVYLRIVEENKQASQSDVLDAARTAEVYAGIGLQSAKTSLSRPDREGSDHEED
ncbi:MAG: carbon storage regulator [Deltaproteobacteria bacterium RIFOXYA12_FULL_61_11]|nr:MAG: carbon storage regulator [Deltaproteobacteria bacterium RIFOXYA12_FULL_61_11]